MGNMADNNKNTPKTEEQDRLYKLKLIWFRIKHGLILFSFLNLLQRIGIEINPYWVDLEGLDRCSEPKIMDNSELFQLGPLDKSVVLSLYKQLGWPSTELEKRLKSDYHGVGLYREKELAAFMLMRYHSFSFKDHSIHLAENEAYLENMYTYEHFRGKNLAPYLRYQCYILLEKEGKTKCFSITQYYNKSSRKFKSKLNAVHHELRLQLGLFKKYRWNFLLKKYPVG